MELVNTFSRMYVQSTHQQLIGHFRWFLRAAIECGHTRLLQHLKTNIPYQWYSRITQESQWTPDLYAICINDVYLFEALVPTTEVDLMTEIGRCNLKTVMYNGQWHCSVSAVEYACIMNRPEILRFLVTWDEQHETEAGYVHRSKLGYHPPFTIQFCKIIILQNCISILFYSYNADLYTSL